MRGIHGDVAEDAKIIARLESREMGLQNISKSRAVHYNYILFVGEEFDAACFKKWHFWRKASSRFVLARQLLRFDLAGLHVGLVEGIDADDGSRYSRSDLPPEKFLAQIVNIRERNAHNGVPGLFKRGNRSVLSLIGLCCESQVSKHSIVAIDRRLREAFPIHGNDPFADFSCGFGNQLFEPGAQ